MLLGGGGDKIMGIPSCYPAQNILAAGMYFHSKILTSRLGSTALRTELSVGGGEFGALGFALYLSSQEKAEEFGGGHNRGEGRELWA